MTGNPGRVRRRLFAAIALGVAVMMVGSLPLQLAGTPDQYRAILLALVALGSLIAIPASLWLAGLELTALCRPALQGELHDELSARNSVRAMAVGYGVMLFAGVVALPLSAILHLSSLPVLTVTILLGVTAQTGSFALFERQGDHD